jgi:NNP family nitrate/nitrite transporter-like MFS transporter
VFQLVPQRFPKEIGILTGLVGAAGGIGGFFFPSLMGAVKANTGSFSGGFLLLGIYAVFCLVVVTFKSRAWNLDSLTTASPVPAAEGAR